MYVFRCETGFYGDPRLGIDIGCRPCPCPGTEESGHSFADTCYLDSQTQDVVCNCKTGYAGKPTRYTALDLRNIFGNFWAIPRRNDAGVLWFVLELLFRNIWPIIITGSVEICTPKKYLFKMSTRISKKWYTFLSLSLLNLFFNQYGKVATFLSQNF